MISAVTITGSDTQGTYENTVKSLTTGSANAQGLILYDSRNRLSALSVGNAGGIGKIAMSARAEGKRPLCLMTVGTIYIEPATWAIGNIMGIGMRIGAFEQTADTGLILTDAQYSMWSSLNYQQSATFANMRRTNLWERRVFKGFSTNSGTILIVNVKARFRIWLAENECLALYLEGETTSVNIRYQMWLRTLISDDG